MMFVLVVFCSIFTFYGKFTADLLQTKKKSFNFIILGSSVKAYGGPAIVQPTPQKCCSTNEILYREKLCYERSCKQELSGIQISCIYEESEFLYCDCDIGFFRNNRGKCDRIDKCEGYKGTGEPIPVVETSKCSISKSCCGENEELKTVIDGCVENTCEKKRNNFQASCSSITPFPKADYKFCDCVTNFFRNSKKRCVPFKQCDDKKPVKLF